MLDLVTEELDAKGLASGTGEDVHEPSTDRDLPTLLGPLDTLVAGEGESFDEAFDPWLVPRREAHDPWSFLDRRHPFGERACRNADEAAVSEHCERSSALADEVSRRLEPGAEMHTPARKKCDAPRIAVPRDRLGGVASLFILGE